VSMLESIAATAPALNTEIGAFEVLRRPPVAGTHAQSPPPRHNRSQKVSSELLARRVAVVAEMVREYLRTRFDTVRLSLGAPIKKSDTWINSELSNLPGYYVGRLQQAGGRAPWFYPMIGAAIASGLRWCRLR
jgi:hypothetical protein